MVKRKRTKGQTMIEKTLNRKLKIVQHKQLEDTKGGNQKSYIKGQTIQWPKDTKGGNQKSYIKGQTIQWLKEKELKTNNDLQNTTQKTKDCETRDPLKTGSELMCSGRVGSSCSS